MVTEIADILNSAREGKNSWILVRMLTTDEDALVCDLAETYHVFDYRSMSVQLVAVLAAGLSDDLRVKRKISGMPISLNTLLLARAVDHLAFLAWTKTKDAAMDEIVQNRWLVC